MSFVHIASYLHDDLPDLSFFDNQRDVFEKQHILLQLDVIKLKPSDLNIRLNDFC